MTLRVQQRRVPHADQAVVGVNLERVVLVAGAEAVGDPLPPAVTADCGYLWERGGQVSGLLGPVGF